MANILIIDDEKSIRNSLRDILEYEKYKLDDAEDGYKGIKKFRDINFDLVLCDIKMPGMDGMEVLEKLLEINSEIPIIMMSGHANIETAVDAVKTGAFDFISKPLDLNRLLITVRNALDKNELVVETKKLKKKVSAKYEMIGESAALNEIKSMIDKVAPTSARVLITGENGTGKELVSHWIHEKSKLNKGRMVEVNCAAIPSELIESELFGHEKGAFTSAIKQNIGKFEEANGGTLFLDEIGDMSLAAQAKVLRALQENKITRVGGNKEIAVNVRVLSATNKNLLHEISEGRFREDLYHRLSVIIVNVPPLKERKDDIPLLTQHFSELICKDYGIPTKEFSTDAINALKEFKWPGNIREFRNVIERLIILGQDTITFEDINNFVKPTLSR